MESAKLFSIGIKCFIVTESLTVGLHLLCFHVGVSQYETNMADYNAYGSNITKQRVHIRGNTIF